MEPPVSSPSEVAQRKPAVAAPEPPLDPPVRRSRFHGFRGGLNRSKPAPHGELGHVRLPKKHRSRPFQVGDDGGVLFRDKVLQDASTAGGPDALGPELVLDRHGNAVHRPQVLAPRNRLFSLAGSLQRLAPRDRQEGVELEVQRVDSLKIGLGNLDGGDLSRLDQPRELSHGEEWQIASVHYTGSFSGRAHRPRTTPGLIWSDLVPPVARD